MVPGCKWEQSLGHEVAHVLSTCPGGHSGKHTQRDGTRVIDSLCYPLHGPAEMEGCAAPGPGYSPGQPCRLHSCHCCVSRARHGAPSGRSSQLLWRTMVPPPQTAEHSLQDDQGPRTGHSRGGHTRDPLRHVLWTGCTPRTQAPSHDEQLSCPSSAQSLDLPHVTHPKPLAWFGRRAAYQLWQSSWTTCVGTSSHEPLALGRPQWQEEMGTQCPSCTS